MRNPAGTVRFPCPWGTGLEQKRGVLHLFVPPGPCPEDAPGCSAGGEHSCGSRRSSQRKLFDYSCREKLGKSLIISSTFEWELFLEGSFIGAVNSRSPKRFPAHHLSSG